MKDTSSIAIRNTRYPLSYDTSTILTSPTGCLPVLESHKFQFVETLLSPMVVGLPVHAGEVRDGLRRGRLAVRHHAARVRGSLGIVPRCRHWVTLGCRAALHIVRCWVPLNDRVLRGSYAGVTRSAPRGGRRAGRSTLVADSRGAVVVVGSSDEGGGDKRSFVGWRLAARDWRCGRRERDTRCKQSARTSRFPDKTPGWRKCRYRAT